MEHEDVEKLYRKRIYDDYVRTHRTYKALAKNLSPRPLRQFISVVTRFFPSDRAARIVDLGCGSGDLILAASRAGYRNVMGVDNSEEQVKIAQKRGISTITAGDAFDFMTAQPDSSINFIIAYDLLEHFDRNELFAICDIVFQKLTNDGVFLVHVPNAEGIFGSRMRYGDLTHEVAFTASSLTQLLGIVGFSRLQFYPDRPIIHNAASFVRAVVWSIVETFARFALAAETGQFTGIFTQNMFGIASKNSTCRGKEPQA